MNEVTKPKVQTNDNPDHRAAGMALADALAAAGVMHGLSAIELEAIARSLIRTMTGAPQEPTHPVQDAHRLLSLWSKSPGGIYWPMTWVNLEARTEMGYPNEFSLRYPGQISELKLSVSGPQPCDERDTSGHPDFAEQPIQPYAGVPLGASETEKEIVTVFFRTSQ